MVMPRCFGRFSEWPTRCVDELYSLLSFFLPLCFSLVSCCLTTVDSLSSLRFGSYPCLWGLIHQLPRFHDKFSRFCTFLFCFHLPQINHKNYDTVFAVIGVWNRKGECQLMWLSSTSRAWISFPNQRTFIERSFLPNTQYKFLPVRKK